MTHSLLRKYFGVSILHEDVKAVLTTSLRNSLGIKLIQADHVVEVGDAIVENLENVLKRENPG